MTTKTAARASLGGIALGASLIGLSLGLGAIVAGVWLCIALGVGLGILIALAFE